MERSPYYVPDVCGICGILGPPGNAAPDDVVDMTRRLAHRGPDDTGTWQTDGRDHPDLAVALGHTRLSIIDLSALGHQPMFSDGGEQAIVYNGELYNYRELRRELEKAGHPFRSDSDTEVVLKAYLEWGDDAFDRFNGMFALAIWDGAARRLVLARDRMGIKPLYYRFVDGVLTFGSELSALRAHSRFRPEIDPRALDTYLRYGWTTGEDSIYADTRRVLPGHLVIWSGGSLEQRPFWQLVDHGPAETQPSYDGIVDQLEALLGDSVEKRMIADVPLGAFLSGGVDSSVIVALMQQRAAGRVRTFSIGFDEAGFDEAPHARAVAEHLGTEHTELYVTAQQARDVVQELPTLYDEPYSDSSAVPTVLLSRMTRESVTVALTGDGGDELFGGYDRYQKLARLLPVMGLPSAARRLLGALSPLAGGGGLRNGLLKLGTARDRAQLAELFLDRFPNESLVRGVRGACSDAFRGVFESAPSDSALRRAMYAEARTYMNDDVLVKVDRATMSVGLEARVPILDHRVVEFAFGLPMSALWRNRQTKAPLRSVLYRHVPRELIERPKQGFGLPVRSLLGAELDDWRDRFLAPERLAEEGLLDPAATGRVVERARANPSAFDSEIWRLVSFQRWHARTHLGER